MTIALQSGCCLFSKHSPEVLTATFSHAKAKALREDRIHCGELASPANLSSDVSGGASAGEVVGGSAGDHGDFLTPDGGPTSVLESAVDRVEPVRMTCFWSSLESRWGRKLQSSSFSLRSRRRIGWSWRPFERKEALHQAHREHQRAPLWSQVSR